MSRRKSYCVIFWESLLSPKHILCYKAHNISKISVIGVGMRSHAGVAQTLFETLGKSKINIQVITTSEIKISILIDEQFTDLAVQKLHKAYKLHI